MRTTIHIDSATPQEVYDLTLAFQRTLARPVPPTPPAEGRPRFELPTQITTEPRVTVGGNAMGWESPALKPDHAVALLAEFDALQGKGKS